MTPKDEEELFKQIADQLLAEDPGFARRSTLPQVEHRLTRNRLVAIFSVLFGVSAMLAAVNVSQPFLGLLAFILMLMGVLPAVRDFSVILRETLEEMRKSNSGNDR